MKIKVKKIKNPIIVHSLSKFELLKWDALWAYHPCVIQHGGMFYLLYSGKSMKWGISHGIGIAKSTDLKTWVKYSKKPILTAESSGWDSDFVAHGYVFKEGNTFFMLYDGSKKGRWREEIGLAQSRDLIHWEKYPNNPIFRAGSHWWENRHVSRCCLFKVNGWNFLFYAGHDGASERIGVAKGKTIFTFKRFLKEPVLDVGKRGEWDEKSISDPRVIKYKDRFFMFYSGIDRNGVERTGVAISSNLSTWKKYEGNPILDISEKSWDRISATRADIKKFHGHYYIFYSGRKNYFYDIGIAKMEIT